MPHVRLFLLTAAAMLAFAGNSLLCRLALKQSGIDAASFTSVRVLCGGLVLWLLVRWRSVRQSSLQASGLAADQAQLPLVMPPAMPPVGPLVVPFVAQGNWGSATALFVYAAGFSFAYVSLPAASGALLLFGAVQATMLGFAWWRGERFGVQQIAGLLLALCGLLGLLLPGLSAPPLLGALLMICAGVAWGLYSLRAKSHGNPAGDPTAVTAGNFLRATPMALALSLCTLSSARFDGQGLLLAAASGALASGLGYAIWYTALPHLKASSAATVQLSVPVIAALGGVLLLNEALSLRLALAVPAILGGIALVLLGKAQRAKPSV